MTIKDMAKQLPATISGHHGQLTIMKRNENKYYCLYPQATKEVVPVIRGKSIESVVKKMHKKLVEKNIIQIEKKKKRKVVSEIKNPKSKQQRRKYKLTRQNNLLKQK